MVDLPEQPVVQLLGKPLNLIPVGLREAALDSPTFRATTVHFLGQVEALERWLGEYIKWAGRLVQEVTALEDLVNSFLTRSVPPPSLSETIIDQDYTVMAVRKFAEGAREFWSHAISSMKKMDATVLEPLRVFVQGELRNFKDARQNLIVSQKAFDGSLSRYAAQSRTKEPSALREDAFQLHEARKSYLRSSMEFCVLAPQLRSSFDKLLIRIFSDQWRELKMSSEYTMGFFERANVEVERVRNWSHEMEASERIFRFELQVARKQLEDDAAASLRPSRELEDYSVSTLPALSTQGLSTSNLQSPISLTLGRNEKQGWLFLRALTGKPTRSVWLHRWCFVRNGIFGGLLQSARTGGVEESEQIGVLLCSVRPASQEERRFCFEVKTKDNTILLQAESQTEMIDWFEVFERAKKAVLEDQDHVHPPVAGLPNRDPAFSISPAGAPALVTKALDALGHYGVEDGFSAGFDKSLALAAPDRELRSNVDLASRRSTVSEKDGEGMRESASRIIQKLDLHRKSAAGSQLAGGAPGGTPSIGYGAPGAARASLMSTSFLNTSTPTGTTFSSALSATPVLAGLTDLTPSNTNFGSSPPLRAEFVSFNTLSPATLTSPPAPTNLSKTAVIVNSERATEDLQGQDSGYTAIGVMANFWGTLNPPTINHLEEEPDQSAGKGLGNSEETVHDKYRLMARMEEDLTRRQQGHPYVDDLPPNYPAQLRMQDAQFQLLFPRSSRHDRVLLVFRVAWNPNEQQEFPGRVYVTANGIHFYSNHLGLVLITRVSLDSVDEVTAAPGKDFDYMYLNLKEGSSKSGFTRITIKTFLEDVGLLRRRLNHLIRQRHGGRLAAESVINELLAMEQEAEVESPGLESWENVSLNTPCDGGSGNRKGGYSRKERDVRTTVHIDRHLHRYADVHVEGRQVRRLRLPAEPVVYIPSDTVRMSKERDYDVSAKALFHVMFGDKSTIFQLLYLERRAQLVKQQPWIHLEGGQMTRELGYNVNKVTVLGSARTIQIIDRQDIEILNNHLCYVIKDTKTPWHLPYWKDFFLVSKIIITHISKSQCKLAIYDGVEWFKRPVLFQRMVEKQALDDLAEDWRRLIDIVTDQVNRLSGESQTKKAVHIFGQVGQHAEALPIPTNQVAGRGHGCAMVIRKRPLWKMLFDVSVTAWESMMATCVTLIVTAIQHTLSFTTTHRLLLTMLGFSILANMVYSSRATSAWWTERNAARFMSRLGVEPGSMMARSVSLDILDNIVKLSSLDLQAKPSSKCAITFHSFVTLYGNLNTTVALRRTASSPSRKNLRRLDRAREVLGQHRHDLLVAMRIVNAVEQELIQATWENWLHEELAQCKRVEGLLNDKLTEVADAASKDGATARDPDRLRQWHQDYCGSCWKDLVRLESDRGMVGTIF